MKPPSCRLMTILAGAAFLICALGLDEARAFGIYHKYYANVTGNPSPLVGEGLLEAQPELYNEQTVRGEQNQDNYATLRYFADLPAGALGSYTYAQGDVADFYPFGFEATARVEQISFTVRLDFTVAAGTYPAGVEVGVSGSADGNLWSQVDAGAELQYVLTFGSAELRPPLMQIGTYESGNIEFHEPFDLVTTIVTPGTVLSQPQVFHVSLNAAIQNNWTWTVLSGAPPNYHAGIAEADMYSGLRFTRVTVPAGVTWDSEDHVFLSEVTAVEEGDASSALRIGRNVPNPFNPSTTIRFELPSAGRARLGVYDLAGRLVKVLVDERRDAGDHEVSWDGRDQSGRAAPSGTYLARLIADGAAVAVRMTLVR